MLFYTREVPEKRYTLKDTMKDRRLEEKFCYFKNRLTYPNKNSKIGLSLLKKK